MAKGWHKEPVRHREAALKGLGSRGGHVAPGERLANGGSGMEEVYENLYISKKHNNGDFDYYLVLEVVNLKEAVGDEADKKYLLVINAVAPRQVPKAKLESALGSEGLSSQASQKEQAVALNNYGIHAKIWDQTGNNLTEMKKEAHEQMKSIPTLFGFYMDKHQNRIGATGWDFIKGNIGI